MTPPTSELPAAQQLAATAGPLVYDIGFRYYFCDETVARAEQLGLDVFTFYFAGRGGVLGDVEAPVVGSAFGYFNPEVIAMMWSAGVAKVAPRDAGRAHLECCAEFGRKHLGGRDDLGDLAAALEKVNAAASRAIAGLPLYAAMSAEPVPDDLPAKVMHLIAMLREHSGSVHLAAVVTSGVDPAVAHYIRRPEAWRLFGWSKDQIPTVTDLDRRRLAEVDLRTNTLLAPAYTGLSADEGRALISGLESVRSAVGSDGSAPSV